MKRISSITYSIVFLLMIGGLGVISFTKLIHYYDTGVVENNEWTVTLGSKLETDLATTFYEKTAFVNLNGAVHRILGQREMNSVVKLENGYLLTTYDHQEEEKLQRNADKIIQMKHYLDEKGIAFLYVIPPYTSSKYDPQLPAGFQDYGNDNLDRFAKMLEEGGVELLKKRKTMQEDGVEHYNMMYKTDHHWTTKAGFYAYTKINRILMQRLDCEVDPKVLDFSNYSVTTYPKWHLGSRGQRTGAHFAGIDDFDLILPVFETDISDGSEQGEFEDIVISKKALDNRDQTSRYTYDSVLGKSFTHNFTNDRAMNDKRILMVTDSYGKAVNPFLILSYGEVRNGNADYPTIHAYNPDAVVVLHYIDNILKDDIYDDCVGVE